MINIEPTLSQTGPDVFRSADRSPLSTNSAELILGIETATRGGSIALARGGELLGSREGDPMGTASTQLLVQIEELLGANGLRIGDVDRLAVAIGPGSFTGLRIGLATVKGLAATLGCAVSAVPTLHAIAWAAGTGYVVAMLPAGRGEVFAQTLRAGDESISEIGPPDHLPLEKLLESKRGVEPLTWIAAGGLDPRQAIADAGAGHEWKVAEPLTNLATQVAAVARLGQRDVFPADLTAMYVRLSDAELKVRCQP